MSKSKQPQEPDKSEGDAEVKTEVKKEEEQDEEEKKANKDIFKVE